MQTTFLQRVHARLHEMGISQTEASRRAGLNPGYLRDLERKNVAPSSANVEKIAKALDVTPAYLLLTHDDEDHRRVMAELSDLQQVPVVGTIEAGNFRDITIQSQAEPDLIAVPRSDHFPQLGQYALLVSGDSVNRIVLEGTYVICVDFVATRANMRDGMLVHVERRIAGGHLVETTLKVIRVMPDGRKVLEPRSTNPVHQPIEIEGDEATEILVRGLVVSLWKPMPRTW